MRRRHADLRCCSPRSPASTAGCSAGGSRRPSRTCRPTSGAMPSYPCTARGPPPRHRRAAPPLSGSPPRSYPRFPPTAAGIRSARRGPRS